ncbi:MAG: ABC transporter substrate-binding protein [Burkholderiales bacterium]|jgi:iron complex transport system substrate-binding protein|nr:ABC transporter substrate-binding protein [Burkholderiales bacterium]
MNRRLALHTMAISLGSVPLMAQAESFPRQLKDALGHAVELLRYPQRIVVIFPSNVELAFSLGLENRIVAIGGRVKWPESATRKPSIGGALGFSPEAVAAYDPDLVVITPSHHSALGLREPFRRIGVPVLTLEHPDLNAIFRNLRLLGRATGTETNAEIVIQKMQTALQTIASKINNRPKPKVYLETAAAERGIFQTVGPGHYAHDALHWAGGENIFSDLRGAQQVSAEAIFARQPDVIISLQQNPKSTEQISQRPGWRTLKAVQEQRVYVMPRGHKLIPGPRQIEAVQAYAEALHPDVVA